MTHTQATPMPSPPPPPFFTSPLLSLPHGMFTRAGGTSTAPFDTLNLSTTVGDQAAPVAANRAQACAALGLRQLVSVKQVHGDRILMVEEAHLGQELAGYDALISTMPDTGLLIQQADCQAILLAEAQAGVIAAIHCGWRGSVCNIIAKTIACLQSHYGVRPDQLVAAISPSLGPCCAEFINYRQELPVWMHDFQVKPLYFDFWEISRQQLRKAGLHAERISVAGRCTCCDQQFFSYRRAVQHTGGITGRNGSIIGLPAVGI
jgi:YfiH family protein